MCSCELHSRCRSFWTRLSFPNESVRSNETMKYLSHVTKQRNSRVFLERTDLCYHLSIANTFAALMQVCGSEYRNMEILPY